jgi:acyl-CoA synthetase (AMP-forming)/AMP-acid ligase II
MTKIIIWQGYHGRDVFELIQKTMIASDVLLILCPPRIDDIEAFYSFLPNGEIEFRGELAGRKSFHNNSSIGHSEFPHFGLFSSGTTDTGPKLILYTKKNLDSACEGIFSFFKELNIKSIYSYPQPYHIFGLSLGYFAALKFNWELVFEEGKYSRAHHEKWVKQTYTNGESLVTLGTPTHFLDAINFVKDNSVTLYRSLTSIAGGAKVEVSLWNKMQNELRIKSPSIGYGCSETSPGVTHLPPGLKPTTDGDLGFVIPCGKLLETANGFIYQGDNVCTAIIQNGSIIFPNGAYLLSDTLAHNEAGQYNFIKRSDLVLNRGGEKFSLDEFEAQIKKEFKVNCVAVAMLDPRLGEELSILFEGPQSLGIEIHKKISAIFKRNFKREYILEVSTIPVNANAKFDRKKCLELIMARVQ